MTEHEREDLLREATALVERVSIRLPSRDDEVLIGFRRDHSAAFYFGAEPVYQFTSNGRLRRAFSEGALYKAEAGRLVRMIRRRTADATELVATTLDESATRAFLEVMRRDLERLHDALAKGNFRLVGQIPADADMIARVNCWLDEFTARAQIADSPRAD